MEGIIKVVIVAILSFLVLFILSKMLGKKQIAQLDFVDYVIGISIGSIAAEMAFDTQTPFYYFIIAMVIFFLLALAVDIVGRKTPFLKRLFKGKPIVLIYKGELMYDNLKKSKLDINDLLAMSRALGYFDLSKIEYAVLETSGNLSIMPVPQERPIVAKDFDKSQPASLPNYLVIDGEISYSGLNELNKNTEWLLSEMKIPYSGLKNVLLASYDSQSQSVITQFKKYS